MQGGGGNKAANIFILRDNAAFSGGFVPKIVRYLAINHLIIILQREPLLAEDTNPYHEWFIRSLN